MRGKKGAPHRDPGDPPRRRANRWHGLATYAHDRPPVMGTVGRETGPCRLPVVEVAAGAICRQQVHRATATNAICYTDEWRGYSQIERTHASVCHSQREWARDADGDGIREVHTNTIEGLWTGVRNFLRPFRGVHKKYLKYYIAMCEHRINTRRISPAFISRLVAHKFFT